MVSVKFVNQEKYQLVLVRSLVFNSIISHFCSFLTHFIDFLCIFGNVEPEYGRITIEKYW